MIWAILFALVVAVFCWFTLARSDLKDAAVEARFPPLAPFVQVSGRDVHIAVEGHGLDLVLIHGAGGNARDFTYRLTCKLSDRYRVFSVDRPGHGWSAPIDPRAGRVFSNATDSPRDQARHLAEAIKQLGASRPIVLGHSYGGAVAMGWALEADPAGLVILSGATMPWKGPLQPFYRVFGSQIGGLIGPPLVSAFVTEDRIAKSLKNVFAPAPLDPNYQNGAAIALGTRAETFRINARQVNTLLGHVTEMSTHYLNLTLPVEILHGTEDVSVRPEIHAELLMSRLPNAELTLLQGFGHAPQHVAPEPVIDAIDRLAARAGLR